jgi:hypothetical protein
MVESLSSPRRCCASGVFFWNTVSSNHLPRSGAPDARDGRRQPHAPVSDTSGIKKPPVAEPRAAFKADHHEEAESKELEEASVLGRPGSDLLFQVLRLSTIGAGEFYGRVRDGIGYRLPASTTRPAKDRGLKQANNAWRITNGSESLRLPSRHSLIFAICKFWSFTTSNRMRIEDKSDQAKRAISTGKLNALPRLHTRPINVVVYHGS